MTMEKIVALTPTNNAALIQEVDDAVRQDRMTYFWQHYGKLLLGVVVAALLAFGGYLYWQHRQTQAAGVYAEQLTAALEEAEAGQTKTAGTKLAALASDSNAGYKAAALLAQANLALADNDSKKAATLLGQIAADTSVDQAMRDMALVRQTAVQFDTLKPADVIARLAPIVGAKDPVSAWFPSAAELTAISYYNQGKLKEAGSLFGQIARAKDVPESLKSRSVQMAGMLGVDAVVETPAAGGDATAKQEEAKK